MPAIAQIDGGVAVEGLKFASITTEVICFVWKLLWQLRGGRMLVQVKWTNNRYDYVNDYMLDSLIEARVVARFLRSSGWVTVGVDPIRNPRAGSRYGGPERRSAALVVAD